MTKRHPVHLWCRFFFYINMIVLYLDGVTRFSTILCLLFYSERTSIMEPDKDNGLTVGFLENVLYSLQSWSSKSFQGFLESGLAHDFAEAVKMRSFNLDTVHGKLVPHGEHGCSYKRDVSIPQVTKIISIAPKDVLGWCYFFELINIMGRHSEFFEKIVINWEDRDWWRQSIGLKPINPTYQNNQGQSIVFRRTGHCGIWINPPLGYRYADIDEIQITAIETLNSVLVDSGSGYYRWKKLGVVNNEIRTGDIDAVRFFQNNIFFVPIVKN